MDFNRIEPFDADEASTFKLNSTMDVLLVEPGQYPKRVQMGTQLEDLQKAVDGYIEFLSLDDESAIICNEEGKIDGMPLNRAFRGESGEILDIISGPFLIVGVSDDGNTISLTPDQMKKYEKKYHQPEAFMRANGTIMSFPIQPQEPKEPKKSKTEDLMR